MTTSFFCILQIIKLQYYIKHYIQYPNMGLIKEPKNIDLSTKSEPWTEQELIDFRKIMQDIKDKNVLQKKPINKDNEKKELA